MTLLPDTDRILLGPGPSLTAPRVMRAMASPTLSHLDPIMMALLDDVRARLGRIFGTPKDRWRWRSLVPGRQAWKPPSRIWCSLVSVFAVVTGYFGDRLAQMSSDRSDRYTAGGRVGTRMRSEKLRRALAQTPVDVVALVHAETSTGVLNPIKDLAAIAREHDALVLVDAVTSLGGHQLNISAWGIDACYSCTQKCLGAPSEFAPIVFTPRALLERRVPCRSFYLDLSVARRLLDSTQVSPHHVVDSLSTPSTKRWRSLRKKASRLDGQDTSAITTCFSTV